MSCMFCTEGIFWGEGYREKSNKRLIEELEREIHSGINNFAFIVSSFAPDISKSTEFLEEILRKGMKIRWLSMYRASTIVSHPELIELSARAGCIVVYVGFETYEDTTLDKLRKQCNTEINFKASEILRKNGIAVLGTHMIGIKYIDTRGKFVKTSLEENNAIIKNGKITSDAFEIIPFELHPGSRFWNEVTDKRPLPIDNYLLLTGFLKIWLSPVFAFNCLFKRGKNSRLIYIRRQIGNFFFMLNSFKELLESTKLKVREFFKT